MFPAGQRLDDASLADLGVDALALFVPRVDVSKSDACYQSGLVYRTSGVVDGVGQKGHERWNGEVGRA